MDLAAIKLLIDSIKGMISIAKDSKELIPEGEKRDAFTSAVDEVEQASSFAIVDIADELGYEVCRCEFPPNLMLQFDRKHNGTWFRCPICSSEVMQKDRRMPF